MPQSACYFKNNSLKNYKLTLLSLKFRMKFVFYINSISISKVNIHYNKYNYN